MLPSLGDEEGKQGRYDLTSSQLVTILGYRAAPLRGTYVIVTYATVPLETVCRCRAIVRARMQLLQRHVLLGRGVRTVVVGRLVPSKGLLLVRRALDESIESGRTLRRVVCRTPRRVAVRSQHRDATLASDAPRAAPWYIPIPADAEGLHGARYRV